MSVSKELLEILACPRCGKSVKESADGEGLVCENCRLIYPINKDIPVMLIDFAKSYED
jgi:uncharacterized protein YbaR (Trm112 family)